MSFGIIEVISLLLGMAGFGLQANPKAPSVDQSLEYAIPDADLVGQIDAASLIPGNFKVLSQLADQPQIKSSPDLVKIVRQAVTEVESARGLAKTMTGIDVATDIADATAFVQNVPQHDPNLVIAVHGKFSTSSIDKIAKMVGKGSVASGGGAWVEVDNDHVVAVTKTGVLLFGTGSLIKARLDSGWKPPGHGAGTNLGAVADVLAGKPVFAVIVTLSAAARAEVLANMPGQNFGTDLVKRGKLAAFAIYHDGIGWNWIDSSRSGLDAIAEVSDGTVDVLRAFQIAPRGFAKITIGALESYKGVDKRVDALLQHKADLVKIMDAYTGDGSFKAQVDKDPKALRLNVRLTGKSLSEVLPVGGLVPLAAIGFMTMRGAAATTMPPAMIVAPPMPAAPASKKK